MATILVRLLQHCIALIFSREAEGLEDEGGLESLFKLYEKMTSTK
jgi:hypothetical protein